MSSPWTERQGYIGDLLSKSKYELSEILHRQEKLLSNRRFVQSLPDKGRKISDFAQRVRLALAHHEEEERRQDMLSSVRIELQSKYRQALSLRQPGDRTDPLNAAVSETSITVPTPQLDNRQDFVSKATPADKHVGASEPAVVTVETASDAGAGISVAPNRIEEKDLADALEKVTLTEGAVASSARLSGDGDSGSTGDNPFSRKQPQKKPHYIDVLEKTEKSAATRKPKFMLNQLPQRCDGSPTGSSPGQSPGQSPGSSAPLSAFARRQRDRKHLDDITAAKLPPLHHSPAQLLSLEESVTLQQEHNRKHKDLEAKMAAQKLSGRLGVRMASYIPEVGQNLGYRESPADDAELSSDED